MKGGQGGLDRVLLADTGTAAVSGTDAAHSGSSDADFSWYPHHTGEGGAWSVQIPSWKVVRAGLFVKAAWFKLEGAVPSLSSEAQATLFTRVQRFSPVRKLCLYILMFLMVFEIPQWCDMDDRCSWFCYPTFLPYSWYLSARTSVIVESALVAILIAHSAMEFSIMGSPRYLDRSRRAQLTPVWLQHGTLLVYAINLASSLIVGPSATMWISGYCRVVLLISYNGRTWAGVRLLTHLMWTVMDIWFLLFVLLMVYSWVGLMLFSGSQEGDEYFPSVGEGMWNLLILSSTTNYPTVMVPAYESNRWSIFYFILFVVPIVFFVTPLSLAVIFNVFRGGRKNVSSMEHSARHRRISLAFAELDVHHKGWISIDSVCALLHGLHKIGRLSRRRCMQLEAELRNTGTGSFDGGDSAAGGGHIDCGHERMNAEAFEEIIMVLEERLKSGNWMSEMEWYFPRIYQSKGFQWLIGAVHSAGYSYINCLLTVATLATLFLEGYECGYGIANTTLCTWDYVLIGLVGVSNVMEISNLLCNGWAAYIANYRNCIELTLVVLSDMAAAVALIPNKAEEEYGMVALRGVQVLRAISILSLMSWWPRFYILFSTLASILSKITTYLSLLFAWMMLMGTIGLDLFGGMACDPSKEVASLGQICPESVSLIDNTYTELGWQTINFNDMPSALTTLFVLLPANDWHVIAEGFVDYSGTNWTRLYFLINFFVGVTLILNLIVSFVLSVFWEQYKKVYRQEDRATRAIWGMSARTQSDAFENAPREGSDALSRASSASSMQEMEDNTTGGGGGLKINPRLSHAAQRLQGTHRTGRFLVPTAESPVAGSHAIRRENSRQDIRAALVSEGFG